MKILGSDHASEKNSEHLRLVDFLIAHTLNSQVIDMEAN